MNHLTKELAEYCGRYITKSNIEIYKGKYVIIHGWFINTNSNYYSILLPDKKGVAEHRFMNINGNITTLFDNSASLQFKSQRQCVQVIKRHIENDRRKSKKNS